MFVRETARLTWHPAYYGLLACSPSSTTLYRLCLLAVKFIYLILDKKIWRKLKADQVKEEETIGEKWLTLKRPRSDSTQPHGTMRTNLMDIDRVLRMSGLSSVRGYLSMKVLGLF